jgi:hypothetical protein
MVSMYQIKISKLKIESQNVFLASAVETLPKSIKRHQLPSNGLMASKSMGVMTISSE